MKDRVIVRSNIQGLGGNYQDVALSAITTGLQQLLAFEKQGSGNSDLQWEIKLYRWILAQPDAQKRADEYLSARHSGDRLVSKRNVVRNLKWPVI